MTLRHRLIVTVCTFAAIVVDVTSAHAQEQLTGTWQYSGSRAEAAERQAAIDAATQDLSMFIRARARQRLATRTAPAARLSVALIGDRVELTDSARSIVVRIGGPPVEVEGDNGRGRVRASRHQGRLVVSISGESGSRTTTYRISPDGLRLLLHVRMTADRLSRPIVFRSTYRRLRDG